MNFCKYNLFNFQIKNILNMYRQKLLLLFGSLVVYVVIVLLFIYKSSKDLKSKKVLTIAKLERSYVNTETHNTPFRTVFKNYSLL